MRFFIGLIILIVVIAAGLLVAPLFVDWSQYKDQGLAQIKKVTGYDVQIDGDFQVGFLPAPHVKAENVKVINGSVSSDPFVSFDAFSVGVALAPLLNKEVRVTHIDLVKPFIDVRKNADGSWNWSNASIETQGGGAGSVDGGEQDKKSQKLTSSKPIIRFDRISITDGRLRYFDAASNKETVLTEVQLGLGAQSLRGPFDVDGSFVFGNAPFAFDGKTQELDDDLQSSPVILNII